MVLKFCVWATKFHVKGSDVKATLERHKFLKVKRMKRRKEKSGFLGGSRSGIRLCTLRSNCLSDKGKSRSARKHFQVMSGRGWHVAT